MSGRARGVARDQAPPRGPLTAAVVLAVAAGGMAGTLARWLLVEVVPSPS